MTLFFHASNTNDWYSTFSQEAVRANSCDKVIQLLLRFLAEAEKNPEINLHLDEMAYILAHNMDYEKFLKRYGNKYIPYTHLFDFAEKNACLNKKELSNAVEFITKTLILRINKMKNKQ